MKNWKSIVGILGVFVLGMAAGALLIGGVLTKRLHRVAHGEPLFTAEEITRRLSRRLDLDAAQRGQVLANVQAAQARIKDARNQCEPQIRAAIEDSLAKTREVLHPEQIEKFDKFVAERRAKWSQPPHD